MTDRNFSPPAPLSPSLAAGRRIYAVGDIHGRLDLLRGLLDAIADDLARHPPPGPVTMVFLGDYVDRGPHSAAVVDLLAAGPPRAGPLAGCGWVTLRGNHEDTLLRFLDDAGFGPGWFRNGGLETIRSYAGAVPDDDDVEALRRRLAGALPPHHRRFLAGLPRRHDDDGYLFVHAGVRPGVPLDRQDPEDLLWIRDEFVACTQFFGKVVVHGHTIAPAPEDLPNRIGIDTGAYRTGRLTAVALEGGERRFLATG